MNSIVRQGVVCAVLALCIGATSTPTPAPKALSPDAILAQATTYDGESLTASGTVKNVNTHSTPRGTFVNYDLCGTQCIHIIDRTGATITAGTTLTATGTFHAHLDRSGNFGNHQGGGNTGGWGMGGGWSNGGNWGNGGGGFRHGGGRSNFPTDDVLTVDPSPSSAP